MTELPRPWCCPDPALCTPLVQLGDGESMPIDIPQSGQSFICFGECENRADWESLSTYYHIAVRKLDLVRESRTPGGARW